MIRQFFGLGVKSGNYSSEKKELDDMYDYAEKKSVEKKWEKGELDKFITKINKQEDKVEKAGILRTKSAIAASIATLQFGYNYYVAVSRFGQRGQDIADQNRIQDRMVNKILGVTGAFAMGGPVAMGVAAAAFSFNEIIKTNIQNKAYEYRRKTDADQKDIARERIGRAYDNSSRRM